MFLVLFISEVSLLILKCPCVYFPAVYDVIRTRGNFGDATVSWMVSPDFTKDVFPVQGTVSFRDQEFSQTITVSSLVDEVSASHAYLCSAHCNPLPCLS